MSGPRHWEKSVRLDATPSRRAPYSIQMFTRDGVPRLPLYTNRPFTILQGEARHWRGYTGAHARPSRVEIRWGDLVWEWRP